MKKILLGKLKDDAGTQLADGEQLYLTKHDWACGWYWSFGWIGNGRCHGHFESLLYIKDKNGGVKYGASDLFRETNISDSDWWVIRDLFVQAYALQKAAEVYKYGGYQTTRAGVTDLIKDSDMAARLNEDLKKVLDKVWDVVVAATDGSTQRN